MEAREEGTREEEIVWEDCDTDVRVRWALVRRVEEPMGVVFWPPGPSPPVMWTDILQL